MSVPCFLLPFVRDFAHTEKWSCCAVSVFSPVGVPHIIPKPINVCNFFSVKPEIILCHLAGRHSPTESSKMGERGRGSNICPTRVWRLFPFLHLSSSGVKHDSVLIGWIDEVTLVGASVLPQSYYTVAVRLHHLMNERQQEDAYVN